MITIQRNETKLKVSKGAFDLYYKGIGFKVVGVKAEKPAAKAEEVSKPDEKVIENPVPKADEKSEEETEKEPKSEGKEENKAPKTPKNENPKKSR